MPATKINLKIEQGATYRKPFKWSTGSPPQPVNLTGWTARMQIRPQIESDEVLVSLTTENGGITISDPTTGVINLYLSAVATAAFGINDFAEAVYDIEMIAPNSDVIRIIYGNVGLSPEVTR